MKDSGSAESRRPDGGGQKALLVGFAISIVVFVLAIATNPGSPEKAATPWGFTKEEKKARHEEFRKSTPAKVELGRQLYATNCAYCHSENAVPDYVVSRIQGEGLKLTDTSEVGLYRMITNGIRESTMKRGDYLSFDSRWALVHYLRSLASAPAASSSGDWSNLDAEGI
jgi:mono/diheme cytochrome c family protein